MSAKKAPDLSALLVTSKGAAIPSPGVPQRGVENPAATPPASSNENTKARKTEKTKESKNERPLNFKVSEAFYLEFRQYAAAHDMKLNEVLRKAFDTLKRKQPGAS